MSKSKRVISTRGIHQERVEFYDTEDTCVRLWTILPGNADESCADRQRIPSYACADLPNRWDILLPWIWPALPFSVVASHILHVRGTVWMYSTVLQLLIVHLAHPHVAARKRSSRNISALEQSCVSKSDELLRAEDISFEEYGSHLLQSDREGSQSASAVADDRCTAHQWNQT